MRILLVTQMWPSDREPDLGSFLVPLVDEFRRTGHEVEVAALSRRGGPPTKYLQLRRDAIRAAEELSARRRLRPFPVPGRPRRRDGGAGRRCPARGDGPRPGRGQPRPGAGDHGRDEAGRGAVRRRHRQLVVARRAALRARPRGARQALDRRLRRGLDAFAPLDAAARSRRARLGRGRRDLLPVPRLADRAQERDPARRRVRAARLGPPRLRRRRAAARAARGPRRT